MIGNCESLQWVLIKKISIPTCKNYWQHKIRHEYLNGSNANVTHFNFNSYFEVI